MTGKHIKPKVPKSAIKKSHKLSICGIFGDCIKLALLSFGVPHAY
ncbi:hypothetical protein AO367_0958 [Moraxella catarrhalis]|nr:hypothetical protein AO380_1342 [Moraxella catarrhalis]OAV10554.1 hypothetical protein AO378_0580 [Moraxella catarrhalis]OAV30734.1 hypothetical protein AO367_0958 [Moraxella catarrhalis]